MSSSKADTGQPVIKTRRFSVSLVWIVPIVAVLVGISLVIHSIMQQGPTIVLNFKTGSGLIANKTEVKYRNVVIGQVTAVALSDDQKSVNATVELVKQAESFTREDSKFCGAPAHWRRRRVGHRHVVVRRLHRRRHRPVRDPR